MKRCFALICLFLISNHCWAGSSLANMKNIIKSKDSPLVVQISPTVELTLAQNSEIKRNGERVILKRGTLRAKVNSSSFTIESDSVSFKTLSEKAEFEVSKLKTGTDLEVALGEVEAISPLIMTFVPEIIKAKEGLSFSKDKINYQRRKYNPKMRE